MTVTVDQNIDTGAYVIIDVESISSTSVVI